VDEIRLMAPERRSSMPRWELKRDGRIIGWIQEIRIGRATRHFFKAIGVDPENGDRVVWPFMSENILISKLTTQCCLRWREVFDCLVPSPLASH